MSDAQPNYLTVAQAARYVGVKNASIYDAARASKLTLTEFAGRRMVAVRELDCWRAARRAKALAVLAEGAPLTPKPSAAPGGE